MDIQVTRLDNRLTVATARMPHVESVAMGIWVAAGARYESHQQGGISHFLEHLLFKGTRRRSALDISRAIEGRGGYVNAFTQEESTCFDARIAASHAVEALDVLCDMYRNPRLAPVDIEREKSVIVEEIQMYRDEPAQAVVDRLRSLLWSRHPLGRPIAGTTAGVRRLMRSDFVQYRAWYYDPSRTVMACAGKLEHDECVRQVRRRLGDLTPSSSRSFRAVTRTTGQEQAAEEVRSVEQTHLALGLRLFGRRDPRRFALRLLNVVLGENMSSRLFQVVRERHGLAYSIQSTAHLFSDTGALVVQAGVDRARAGRALDLIVRELRRLRERAVSTAELRRAREYACGQMLTALEGSTARMMWLGEHLLAYGRVVSPKEILQKLETVTPADIQEVARAVLRSNRTSLSVVSPRGSEVGVEILRRHIARL